MVLSGVSASASLVSNSLSIFCYVDSVHGCREKCGDSFFKGLSAASAQMLLFSKTTGITEESFLFSFLSTCFFIFCKLQKRCTKTTHVFIFCNSHFLIAVLTYSEHIHLYLIKWVGDLCANDKPKKI